MKQPHLRSIAALLCMLSALPGIAHAVTETEPLSMVFEPSPEAVQRADEAPVAQPQIASGCTLYLAGIEDVRSNKTDAGNLTVMLPTVRATPRSVQSLRSGDALPWVRGALQSARRYGFQTVAGMPASAGGTRQVSADVALRLAQAWSTGLNLVSHVVLRVSYRMPGGELVSRQYHGMGTRTNWTSANGEFMSVLNLGIEEAVRGMAVDAAQLCAGKPLAAPPAP